MIDSFHRAFLLCLYRYSKLQAIKPWQLKIDREDDNRPLQPRGRLILLSKAAGHC